MVRCLLRIYNDDKQDSGKSYKGMTMKGLRLTKHAERRLSQRGLSNRDLALMLRYGTETPTGFLLRKKDVMRVEHEMKRLVTRLHHLAGKVAVVERDRLITAFPASSKQQRRRLQGF